MAPSWVAMDKRGRAITPIVTHQDRRSVDVAREIEREIGKARHLQLAGVRPFLSDNLFEAQGYWVQAYKAAGLRNVSDEPKIIVTQLSRVTSDKHFDSMTVRVYAQCLDYTVDESGRQVGGSRTKPRQYSEYWTFIRGVAASGAPRTDDTCPNCGAGASHVNMAGACGSCGVKITRGAFDWVLARIEQDEVYAL